MKSIINVCLFVACSLMFISTGTNTCYAQEIKITMPYDSLSVHNVQATGNLKTGAVTVTMEFQNDYSNNAILHFSLGGYADLGIENEKGKKFKIHTSEDLIGTQNINKGYSKISAVHFGEKKMGSFTYLEDDVNSGAKKQFKVVISNFDKTSRLINDFHVRVILILGAMHSGDKVLKVDHIKITWK